MIPARTFSPRHRQPAGERGVSLVELLVAMSIMGVITAMLLLGWFSLSKSYGYSVHSADARDSGRQAMQRLQREIRDAEKPPLGYLGTIASEYPDAIIYRASPYWIAFSTTFNDVGNSTPAPTPSWPHLVVYRLYADDRELWRFEDLDGGGAIANVNISEGLTVFNVNEQVNGEGARLVLADVVNCTGPSATWVPLFTYNYYLSGGSLQSDPLLTLAARVPIIAVQLRLLVDLNPARAPVHADLRGTAQLRNAR